MPAAAIIHSNQDKKRIIIQSRKISQVKTFWPNFGSEIIAGHVIVGQRGAGASKKQRGGRNFFKCIVLSCGGD